MENGKAIILLDDGTVYRGLSVGSEGTVSGQLCFYSGLTGHQELLTNPALSGRIMLAAQAHIGGSGIHAEESESDAIQVAGLICRNFADHYSRNQSDKSLEEVLKEDGVPVVGGIDTRSLIQKLQQTGPMAAIISTETDDIKNLEKRLKESLKGKPASGRSHETPKELRTIRQEGDIYRIAVLDFGVKRSNIAALVHRHATVGVFPGNTDFETIKAWRPDAVLISNGAGNPMEMESEVSEIGKMIEEGLKIFGIGLGHLLIARYMGMEIIERKSQAISISYPVKNLAKGGLQVCLMTQQYLVKGEESDKHKIDIEVTHTNLNDQSIAGFKLKNKEVFSVVFEPESSPGPEDSMYLYDEFIELIKS